MTDPTINADDRARAAMLVKALEASRPRNDHEAVECIARWLAGERERRERRAKRHG